MPPQCWVGGDPEKWHHKTVDLALGFTKQLSSMLQGTTMDVTKAYKQIQLVKTQLNSL